MHARMSATSDTSALRRKIRAGRGAQQAPAKDVTLRAWRLAVARGMNETMSLPATVRQVGRSMRTPEDLATLPGPTDLIALTEGQTGRFGLVVMDQALLGSMIEAQTMGRVMARPVPERRPTSTDAAMVADALDRVFALFESSVQALGVEDPAFGFRYALPLDRANVITLSLEDAPHHLVSMELDLGGGARQGRLQLAFPGAWSAAQATGEVERRSWSERMSAGLMASAVPIEARLTRLQMPIEEVTGLSPGDLVPVAREDLGRVRLVGPGGAAFARGRLGQVGGRRALRIEAPGAEETPPGLADSTPALPQLDE